MSKYYQLAKRDGNKKRNYLYVNPYQAKHMPTDPNDFYSKLCIPLANIISGMYPKDNLWIIGFAETATALSAGVAEVLSYKGFNIWYQNTTRCSHGHTNILSEYYKPLEFTEAHSHAMDQLLYTEGIQKVLDNNKIDRIVFVDDEVTTGNTICNLIDKIKSCFVVYDNFPKCTIATVLNSMSVARSRELLSKGIECVALEYIHNTSEDLNSLLSKYNYKEEVYNNSDSKGLLYPKPLKYREYSKYFGNYIINFKDYLSSWQHGITNLYEDLVNNIDHEVPSATNILVIGQEEFMFPAILVGKMLKHNYLDVYVQATTRSPICVSEDEDYPLFNRYDLTSDGKVLSSSTKEKGTTVTTIYPTYIYNLRKYDAVILFNCASNNESYNLMNNNESKSLCVALTKTKNEHIYQIDIDFME